MGINMLPAYISILEKIPKEKPSNEDYPSIEDNYSEISQETEQEVDSEVDSEIT